MPVIDVRKDPARLTLTIVSEYEHPVEKVWSLWSDPRKLERWWGPPTHPAAVGVHELVPGGRVAYVMTGPDGQQFGGLWHVLGVDAPHALEAVDHFADADGNINHDLPTTRMQVALAARPEGGTRMSITSHFPSLEAMEQIVAMGMEEGITLALGQADALLV